MNINLSIIDQQVRALSDEESFECLTDGGNDFGVDAIEIGALHDGKFGVTLVQGKYKRDLEFLGPRPRPLPLLR